MEQLRAVRASAPEVGNPLPNHKLEAHEFASADHLPLSSYDGHPLQTITTSNRQVELLHEGARPSAEKVQKVKYKFVNIFNRDLADRFKCRTQKAFPFL